MLLAIFCGVLIAAFIVAAIRIKLMALKIIFYILAGIAAAVCIIVFIPWAFFILLL